MEGLNRFVKKGEHGIRILAPIIRKMEEEREGKIEEVSRPVSFRVVSVFDVAQLKANHLRSWNATRPKAEKPSCRCSKRRLSA